MKFKTFLYFVLFGILLSACSMIEKPQAHDTQSDPLKDRVTENTSLDGTSWILKDYGGTILGDDLNITAQFNDGQVAGSSGCNTYAGSYQLDKDRITFGPLATTMIVCLEPSDVMDIERIFLEWMSDAQTYDLTTDQLKIFSSDGEALIFIPMF